MGAIWGWLTNCLFRETENDCEETLMMAILNHITMLKIEVSISKIY